MSWTHYRVLLKADRRATRDFYEIEALRNGWSARQLERQMASMLFERLAKSRDKNGVLGKGRLKVPLIGLVVMHFNSLEKSLDALLCTAVNERSDAPGLIIIQKLQYAAKVDLFKRIGEELHLLNDGEPLDGLNELVAGLTEVGVLRNQVVHADWDSTDHQGYTFVRVKPNAKKGMELEYVQFTVASLEKIIQQTIELSVMLYEYWDARLAFIHKDDPK